MNGGGIIRFCPSLLRLAVACRDNERRNTATTKVRGPAWSLSRESSSAITLATSPRSGLRAYRAALLPLFFPDYPRIHHPSSFSLFSDDALLLPCRPCLRGSSVTFFSSISFLSHITSFHPSFVSLFSRFLSTSPLFFALTHAPAIVSPIRRSTAVEETFPHHGT